MSSDFVPRGEHDRRLLAGVRPEDWRNPEPAPLYDWVVVGAGTAGLVAAAGAAGLGARVALIERRMLGGDCLNFGCVPSKALLRAARAAADVRAAAAFGVRVPDGTGVDFAAVMERVRRLRADLSANDSVARFAGLGVDVFLGDAQFAGPTAVAVGGKTVRFSKALIATGARPARLPIPGLWEAGALTNETVFGLTARPERLLVVGAGPIGAELAQAFARLGSRVTLLEALHGFLPREDRDASELVKGALERDGVRFQCCVEIQGVERDGGVRRVRFGSKHAAAEETAEFDEIVVGVGRTPNVDGLRLEQAGIAYDERGVTVDDMLRTTNPRVYAAGDVCLSAKFTHAADATARLALQNALFLGRKRLSELVIPACTYTDPELAHVGARAGDGVQTFTQRFHDLDRAVLDGETDGLLQLHVFRGTDKLAGATLVGRHAGETIGELSAALTNGIRLGGLARTIHCYPTQAECIKRAADAYNRTRLTPFVKRLLELWLRFSR
ncbi:MAG: mercuric reductase [Elusimicrobia bacterium]|nr:mercuric reductase [Elusimicrobiota bacterium]